MSIEYRPHGEELMKKPDLLEMEQKEKIARSGDELRDVLPKDVIERLDDYSRSFEAALIDSFGAAEIPKEFIAEQEAILKAIEKRVSETGYVEEVDEKLVERLRVMAVRAANFKEAPTDISVEAVPEEGYKISFTNKEGQRVERSMSEDELDMLFNIEMWAEESNQLQNINAFKKNLAHTKEAKARFDDPEEKLQAIRRDFYQRYEKFGFTREQIDDLIVLADEDEMSDMVPNGAAPGVHKLEIMADMWRKYLSSEEKSKYLKFAVGIVGIGAAEGVTPVLIQKIMDSQTLNTAALFAAGYFGSSAALGWLRNKLNLGFDQFINEVSEKDGGLNQRLSEDLVFQPGEKMAETQDRGRLMTTMRRSQRAFRDVISSMAKVTAPAVAMAGAGIGVMLANDWRLGLCSLASAPIAIAIMRRAERKVGPIIDKTYETEDKTALEVEEQISAHMEIVLSGMRDDMGKRIEVLMKKGGALVQERNAAEAAMEFQSGSVLNPAVMAGLTATGVALRALGVQEPGKIVSALVYSGMFRSSFDTVIRQQSKMLESCKSLIEMEEVFNGYADEEEAADAARVPVGELKNFAVELNDVDLELGDRKIVDGVNISIPAGGVVRIEGASGQGKTTLMKLMAGYYKPTKGSVEVGGRDLNEIKKTGPDSLYSRLIYLSQFPYVFDSGNLRDNLKFGNAANDEKIRSVLTELGLAERFASGGKIDLESKMTGLSGGERRRIGLARVLLKMREQDGGGIVFLDEPTEGLDEAAEDEFIGILVKEKRAHPELTFVAVTHKSRFVEGLEAERDDEPGLSVQRIKIDRGQVKE